MTALQTGDDGQRPRYHFLPPANWLNDPNGLIQWKGEYHLFYQYNPYGPFHARIHWGHAVSPDLVHWTHLPVALTPTDDSPDQDGCWSGCAVDDNGVPTLIYTGVRGTDQRPCLATSDDGLLTWQKYASNPIIAAPPGGLGIVDFRDHVVWQEDGIWYQVIGAGIPGSGGIVFLYQSPDLRNWEYLHPLYAGSPQETNGVWECPDFFPLGDRHVLILSPVPMRKVIFLTGDYADHRFMPQVDGMVDWGGHFYAPQSFTDDAGRRIMFGWIWEGRSPEAERAAGWAGLMLLPRILSLADDGTLRYDPAPELTALRAVQHHLDARSIEAAPPVPLDGIVGDVLEIVASIDPGDAAECGLWVRCAPDDTERTLISYDRARQILTVDTTQSSLSDTVQTDRYVAPLVLAEGELLELHIFLDRSVIEVFANRRVCFTTRVYPTRTDSREVRLFARGGTAQLVGLDAWELTPIWNEA